MAEENSEETKKDSGPVKANISQDILGNTVEIHGEEVDGSLDGVKATIKGPQEAYIIEAIVTRSDEGFLVSGKGSYSNGLVGGELSGSIVTNPTFVPDPNSLNVSGQVTVSLSISGMQVELTGTMENGSLSGLAGTVEGPNGSFLLNVAVVDNGGTYTISGGGSYLAGPIQGSLAAQIQTDASFNIDPGNINLSGEATVDNEISDITIHLSGSFEGASLSGLAGQIVGPNELFSLEASVKDNGESYAVQGAGSFALGPVTGDVQGDILTDKNFVPDPNSINLSGEAKLDTEVAGNSIDLSGAIENGSLANLFGTVEGPNQLYLLNVGIVDNGGSYTITGEGAFTTEMIQGSLGAQIETDESLNPDPSSLNISGDATVDTEIAGFKIFLHGTVEQGSLKNLVGMIEGPQGAFVINVSVVENGGSYTITGEGAFVSGPVQANLIAQIEADDTFTIDPSSLNIGGDATVNTEFAGIKINMSGAIENGSLASLTGVIIGPNELFSLEASVKDNGESYAVQGAGSFALGPVTGDVQGDILTDKNFVPDPNSINLSGEAKLDTEVAGNSIDLSGAIENGSLANLFGTVEGPNQLYLLNVGIVDNGGSYTITGEGAFTTEMIQGSLGAQIETDESLNPDPSSLNISGDATVDTEIAGFKIFLHGTVEQGSLKNLVGMIEGPQGAFVINVSVVENGGSYTITGEGAFVSGPVQANLIAQIEADDTFTIDPSSLNIGGDATVNTEFAGIKINMSGAIENGSLASLTGVIIGPNDFFTLNVGIEDNGDDQYKVLGNGTFTAGPVQGDVNTEIFTDSVFNPDLDSMVLSGNATVNTELAGNHISMAGAMEKGSLQFLEGTVTGPNGLYMLTASVVDNGDTYSITGGGEFTAGPVEGTVEGEIQTDKVFNPDFNSMQISGEASVDTEFLGNHILMNGVMENGSLQSLTGTIEGPNGLYLLTITVVDNGEGYTITGNGSFAMGPVEGEVAAEIGTDANFNPIPETLNISGEANVDTETAGHHILMQGVMLNGSLVSLIGTVEGPNGLYMLSTSVVDNGDTYTITGEGSIDKGPVKGSVQGTINTDKNFTPDFSSLSVSGDASIDTEVAGNKVNATASVNNGYLESISGTLEGPGGLYTINAKGVREGEDGYDLEASGAFTFFDEHFSFEPPAITLPAGIPGVYIEVSSEIGFGAKASADMVTGLKTDPHFIPDFSTFEVRSATLIGHGDVSISLFGGVSVGLPFAKVSAGLKAELKGVIDAVLELTADAKGLKVSGSLYAALLGALYAAVKLKFLFYKKEFDFLIVEGKVASLEKDFGPTDFTLANILQGFQFGIDDISIPGKDQKAKAPELKETSPESEKELEEGKSSDEEAKESDADDQAAQGKFAGTPTSGSTNAPVQRSASGEALPSNLQNGVEKLSGQNMSDVSVHKNSDKPAQLNAHAYAQGTDIHLGPGQEKHLPHEAWHVAQQKQGRVEPTKQLKSSVPINDDDALENEADVMGQKALEVGDQPDEGASAKDSSGGDSNSAQLKSKESSGFSSLQKAADLSQNVSQLKQIDTLANRRDKDGLHQLQSMANPGSFSSFEQNSNEETSSTTENSSTNNSQTEIEIAPQTN